MTKLRCLASAVVVTGALLTACDDGRSGSIEGEVPATSNDAILPDLSPDDGLVPIEVPALGADDYQFYYDACALPHVVNAAAEIVAKPSTMQPEFVPRTDGNTLLRLDVVEVVMNDTDLDLATQVDVLVGGRDNIRFNGSGMLHVWPELQGDPERVLLELTSDTAAPWSATVVRQLPDHLEFVPNYCNTTVVFTDLAEQLGLPADLELMRAVRTAQLDYETCLRSAYNGEGDESSCERGELLDAAERVQFGEI